MATKITIEFTADLDDCERASLTGLIAAALSGDFLLHDRVGFLGIDSYQVRDDEPLTMAGGRGVALQVAYQDPFQIDTAVISPLDREGE